MKSECEYCKHEPFEKDWYLSAATNYVFLLVKIKYCPMCGRKLKGKKKK